MAIGQWEAGCTVIENSRSPGRNRMARGALRGRGWKSSSDVVRYVSAQRRGALECSLMAAVTIRRAERVIVVYMAGRAGGRRRRHVGSGQGKPGRAVIEICRRPTHRRMARRAVPDRKCRARRGVYRGVSRLPLC